MMELRLGSAVVGALHQDRVSFGDRLWLVFSQGRCSGGPGSWSARSD